MSKRLNTFQLVCEDRVISPILTTIRSYGEWFEKTFDEYTANTELYMKSIKKGGERVLESHPGTRIGKFFDDNQLSKSTLISWYILKGSPAIDKLKKIGMIEYRDVIPMKHDGEQALRVYTVEQIEFYIRSTIDRNFKIAEFVADSKQVKVHQKDLDNIIKPQFRAKRTASLF